MVCKNPYSIVLGQPFGGDPSPRVKAIWAIATPVQIITTVRPDKCRSDPRLSTFQSYLLRVTFKDFTRTWNLCCSRQKPNQSQAGLHPASLKIGNDTGRAI
jgi:hypothetical protein